jgi:hypothetical protein
MVFVPFKSVNDTAPVKSIVASSVLSPTDSVIVAVLPILPSVTERVIESFFCSMVDTLLSILLMRKVIRSAEALI